MFFFFPNNEERVFSEDMGGVVGARDAQLHNGHEHALRPHDDEK